MCAIHSNRQRPTAPATFLTPLLRTVQRCMVTGDRMASGTSRELHLLRPQGFERGGGHRLLQLPRGAVDRASSSSKRHTAGAPSPSLRTPELRRSSCDLTLRPTRQASPHATALFPAQCAPPWAGASPNPLESLGKHAAHSRFHCLADLSASHCAHRERRLRRAI